MIHGRITVILQLDVVIVALGRSYTTNFSLNFHNTHIVVRSKLTLIERYGESKTVIIYKTP